MIRPYLQLPVTLPNFTNPQWNFLRWVSAFILFFGRFCGNGSYVSKRGLRENMLCCPLFKYTYCFMEKLVPLRWNLIGGGEVSLVGGMFSSLSVPMPGTTMIPCVLERQFQGKAYLAVASLCRRMRCRSLVRYCSHILLSQTELWWDFTLGYWGASICLDMSPAPTPPHTSIIS